MKKFVVFAAMAVVFSALPVQAEFITGLGIGIDLLQDFGASANFNAGTKTITWSGGVDGWLMTNDGQFVPFSALPNFESCPVNAAFTIMTDTSSGGLASARFTAGAWDISVIADGITVASLTGHVVNNYNETETGVGTDALNGRAIVVVDSSYFNQSYWMPLVGDTIGWDGVGELAGIIGDITLPYGTNIQDYSTSYATDNVIITLLADESQIPEPATMSLLALGGLLLRRKK